MSYQGGLSYMPVQTVDETADVTDMMGQASELNVSASDKAAWKKDPTRMLVVLWLFCVFLYALVGYFFRRYLR